MIGGGGGGGILKVAKSNYVMAFTTISQFGIAENNKKIFFKELCNRLFIVYCHCKSKFFGFFVNFFVKHKSMILKTPKSSQI